MINGNISEAESKEYKIIQDSVDRFIFSISTDAENYISNYERSLVVIHYLFPLIIGTVKHYIAILDYGNLEEVIANMYSVFCNDVNKLYAKEIALKQLVFDERIVDVLHNDENYEYYNVSGKVAMLIDKEQYFEDFRLEFEGAIIRLHELIREKGDTSSIMSLYIGRVIYNLSYLLEIIMLGVLMTSRYPIDKVKNHLYFETLMLEEMFMNSFINTGGIVSKDVKEKYTVNDLHKMFFKDEEKK